MSLVRSRLDYGNVVLVVLIGLPAYLQRRLQAVRNAAACLVFRLRRYDHVTDALATLHIDCACQNASTLKYSCHGVSSAAWSCSAVPQSAGSCRRHTQPSPTSLVVNTVTHLLRVPPFCLSTVGRRSFPVAASVL